MQARYCLSDDNRYEHGEELKRRENANTCYRHESCKAAEGRGDLYSNKQTRVQSQSRNGRMLACKTGTA